MKIQIEVFTMDLVKEMLPMLEIHRQELSAYQDMPLKPDWEKYLALEKLDMFKCFTVRTDNDDLVGYAWFGIMPNMHYMDYTYAIADILYISQRYRGHFLGPKLIKFTEKYFKENTNVSVIIQKVKLAHNWGKLLTALDYKTVELSFQKRIQ